MLTPEMLPAKDKQLFSIGYTCQLLQVVPGQLGVLVESTGVLPAWTIDGTAYFDGDGVKVLVNKANQLRKEIQTAIDKVQAASGGTN